MLSTYLCLSYFYVLVSSQMTQELRNYVLDMHNQKRNRQASGNHQAASMNKLVYDLELERGAQKFAEKCKKGHDDPTRKYGIGENKCYTGKSQMNNALGTCVNRWWAEGQMFDQLLPIRETSYERFKYQKMCGHFTQLIWSASKRLGCGAARCSDGNIHVVCRNDPGGNKPGAYSEFYQVGTPCSKCSGGCDRTYTSLCANGGGGGQQTANNNRNNYNTQRPQTHQRRNKVAVVKQNRRTGNTNCRDKDTRNCRSWKKYCKKAEWKRHLQNNCEKTCSFC